MSEKGLHKTYKLENYTEIVQKKKALIFEKHNYWLEDMKSKILPSGISLYDLILAFQNHSMGDSDALKFLYEKWLLWALEKYANNGEKLQEIQNIGEFYKLDEIKDRHKLIKLNNLILGKQYQREVWYHKNGKKYVRSEHDFYYDLRLDILEIAYVSDYIPIGCCSDCYLYPNMQEKFGSDTYYIIEECGAYSSRFTDLQVAYVPAVVDFMDLNKNKTFFGKKLGEYNVVELLELIADPRAYGEKPYLMDDKLTMERPGVFSIGYSTIVDALQYNNNKLEYYGKRSNIGYELTDKQNEFLTCIKGDRILKKSEMKDVRYKNGLIECINKLDNGILPIIEYGTDYPVLHDIK